MNFRDRNYTITSATGVLSVIGMLRQPYVHGWYILCSSVSP